MTHITDRDAIAIAQIAVYSPLLLLCAFLLRRNGVSRGLGWIFITLLCLLRLVGAALSLATLSNPRSTSLYIGAATCNAIGVSPLFLATVGIISQVTRGQEKKHGNHFLGLTMAIHAHAAELIAAVALVLGIVGAVRAGHDFKASGTYTPQSLAKAAAALFVVVFVAVLGLVVCASDYAVRGMLLPRWPPLLVAAWLSVPLLLVRLVYSCLSSFDGGRSSFNILTGNVWVWLGMAVVEEIVVVVLYVGAGIATPLARNYENDSLGD